MTLVLVLKKGLYLKEYMKYESPITYRSSKDMANVKVFGDNQTDKRTGQKH